MAEYERLRYRTELIVFDDVMEEPKNAAEAEKLREQVRKLYAEYLNKSMEPLNG